MVVPLANRDLEANVQACTCRAATENKRSAARLWLGPNGYRLRLIKILDAIMDFRSADTELKLSECLLFSSPHKPDSWHWCIIMLSGAQAAYDQSNFSISLATALFCCRRSRFSRRWADLGRDCLCRTWMSVSCSVSSCGSALELSACALGATALGCAFAQESLDCCNSSRARRGREGDFPTSPSYPSWTNISQQIKTWTQTHIDTHT